MKASKVLLNIMSVVCYVYGALYLFSLVFIPVGVYCFIAARRFSYKAEHMFDMYSFSNNIFRNYVIFSSIACFPLGLLSIIPYLILTGNNVKISGLHLQKDDNQTSQEQEIINNDIEKQEQKSSEEVVTKEEESEQEKIEKFEKLKNFKEKGLITEEELELAREQLFGKKNN